MGINEIAAVEPIGWNRPIFYASYLSYTTPIYSHPGKAMEHLLSKSKFHTSWDWLMPVIGKIGKIELPNNTYPSGEKVYIDHIYLQTFGMKDDHGHFMVRFLSYPIHKHHNLLTATYNAVINVLETNREFFQ